MADLLKNTSGEDDDTEDDRMVIDEKSEEQEHKTDHESKEKDKHRNDENECSAKQRKILENIDQKYGLNSQQENEKVMSKDVGGSGDQKKLVQADIVEDAAGKIAAEQEEKKDGEEGELKDSSSDDDEDNEINWDETLKLPDPHLITEDQFNKYFPRDLLLESTKKIINLIHGPLEVKKNQKEKRQEKNLKHKKSDQDVFEDVNSASVSIFDDHTKYIRDCPEPKYSDITMTDRKWYRWYVDHLKKSNVHVIALHEGRFQDLLRRMNKEQGEFMQYLYNCFMKNPAEYFFISPLIKDFIKEKTMKDIDEQMKIKNQYSLKQTINMKDIPMGAHQAKLNFVECVKHQEHFDALKVLPMNTPLKGPSKENMKLTDELPFIKQLCVKKSAQFFFDQSALLGIMESLVVPSREWLIPVFIEKQGTRNVICCMKPYPRRNFGIREANRYYYKKCLLDNLQTENIEQTSQHGVHVFECGKHRLLVRNHTDAMEPSTRDTYTISSKIEFQPSIGYEQFSIGDLCNFWWESRLSNTKHILCHRIDPRNNCIRRLDTYSRDTLCGPGCPYNPKIFLNHLNYLLDILSNFQPGTFLLEHAAGNSFFFMFEKTNKGFTTLNTKYKDLLSGKNELIMETQVSAGWLPIDTNILTTHSIDIVPWLFQPQPQHLELIPLGKRVKKKDKKKKKKSISKFMRGEIQYQEPLPPGVDRLSPNLEPPPPGTEPLPPGTEPPPPGTEMDTTSPIHKVPIVYDEFEFDDL